MTKLLYFLLLITYSCTVNKQSYTFFQECEKTNNQFSNLTNCAFDKLKIDCPEKENCHLNESRFIDMIKRLQLMVDKEEISENEAMFRYFNIIDSIESNKYKVRNINQRYSDHTLGPYFFHHRGFSRCFYSNTGFCY